jgi:hypothetical protein
VSEFLNFDAIVRKIFSVPHDEIVRREKQYQRKRKRAKKKKRSQADGKGKNV